MTMVGYDRVPTSDGLETIILDESDYDYEVERCR